MEGQLESWFRMVGGWGGYSEKISGYGQFERGPKQAVIPYYQKQGQRHNYHFSGEHRYHLADRYPDPGFSCDPYGSIDMPFSERTVVSI